MLLKRFFHEGLAQASYLVGCQKTGEALVIDPNRDAEQYIAAAAENGLTVTHVTETHIHADFLSGSRELAQRSGGDLLLSGEGGSGWKYAFAEHDGATLLHDGDSFMVGNLRLDVVHTPGHTPEHLAFILTDTPAGPHAAGAFTGDFLFVGDVGRPDLLERAAHVEGTMREGASRLFHSLQRFGRYPDHLQIWPGHGAGSACGKALGAVPSSSLGYEKLVNWAYQHNDESDFIEAVLAGQPDPPVYFAEMKRLNRDGAPVLGAPSAIPRLSGGLVKDALIEGDVILDVRRADEYALGFIAGSINLPLNKTFVQWAGWLVPYDRDIVLLTGSDDDGVARQAAKELSMIGLDQVRGWAGRDVFTAWPHGGQGLETMAQIEPTELSSALNDGLVDVIDVRADSEWDAGHLPGATHLPLGHLSEHIDRLSRDRPIVTQCQAGSRSAIAASLLRARGFTQVRNLRGGFAAWERAGLPVGRDAAQPTAAR